MGLAMARNIQKHLKATDSPDLQYWNRTLSKGDVLEEIGGKPCDSPVKVVLNSAVVFISVSYIFLHQVTY